MAKSAFVVKTVEMYMLIGSSIEANVLGQSEQQRRLKMWGQSESFSCNHRNFTFNFFWIICPFRETNSAFWLEILSLQGDNDVENV